MIITGGSLKESKHALGIAEQYGKFEMQSDGRLMISDSCRDVRDGWMPPYSLTGL
jgi:hypothetical protein